jgi:hypothetical protein
MVLGCCILDAFLWIVCEWCFGKYFNFVTWKCENEKQRDELHRQKCEPSDFRKANNFISIFLYLMNYEQKNQVQKCHSKVFTNSQLELIRFC